MEESTWKKVLLIPNGGGDFHWILIVSVVLKTVEVILKIHLGVYITLRYILNVF